MTAGRRRRTRDAATLRRRFEDWRIAHDVGLPDDAGRPVRRSARGIAEATGFTPQYVRRGIRAARALREAVADALSDLGE